MALPSPHTHLITFSSFQFELLNFSLCFINILVLLHLLCLPCYFLYFLFLELPLTRFWIYLSCINYLLLHNKLLRTQQIKMKHVYCLMIPWVRSLSTCSSTESLLRASKDCNPDVDRYVVSLEVDRGRVCFHAWQNSFSCNTRTKGFWFVGGCWLGSILSS